jgi:hypothetical protein
MRQDQISIKEILIILTANIPYVLQFKEWRSSNSIILVHCWNACLQPHHRLTADPGTLPSNVQDYNTSTATQLLHRRYGSKQAGSAKTSDKKQQQ